MFGFNYIAQLGAPIAPLPSDSWTAIKSTMKSSISMKWKGLPSSLNRKQEKKGSKKSSPTSTSGSPSESVSGGNGGLNTSKLSSSKSKVNLREIGEFDESPPIIDEELAGGNGNGNATNNA